VNSLHIGDNYDDNNDDNNSIIVVVVIIIIIHASYTVTGEVLYLCKQ